MNLFAPISAIMTDHKHLITVNPEDSLQLIKDIFERHTFHHIPVVRYQEVVGIISRSDFEHFLGGNSPYEEDRFLNERRLARTTAEDIMTTRLGKISSTDRINVAVDIFVLNRFHALPVVDDEVLVGIVTPYDILKTLAIEKPADPLSVYTNQNVL
jgi:acetoin utilization protein AcuB